MPIRISPLHDLGPCMLNLDSMKNIAGLVERDFVSVTYIAQDNIWEIYDEPNDSFIQEISQRETLDSFTVKASSGLDEKIREIEIVFNEKEARVALTGNPENENWFEHFLIDLRKFIHRPSLSQIAIRSFGKSDFYIRLPLLFVPVNPKLIISSPYSRIIIQMKPPNLFIESIKANLIWAALGGIFVLLFQWLWGQ